MINLFNLEVNTAGIRTLYSEGPAAQALLDYMAGCQQNNRLTLVDTLWRNIKERGTDLPRGSLIRLLHKLASLGCGSFISGRRGRKSHFEWAVSMASVGMIATGESDELEDAPIKGSDDDIEMVKHEFKLRSHLPIRIELPIDLSPNEARRMSKFIATLPLESVKA